ncbi:peptidoglycan/LPS O-acetylase OafA/YrhL [Leucobacter exalbidus]|uniref:Peptidoglycan/LPS O-acetylase OafA/YrhL n=1 Tax=Leucobacter exalbidus TaxID=662960 RepID=A0A940T4T2_9MICO|nr:acyltransferase family protein [Leucobacter exalbidus]MBP1327273.1 peptidoglycan/LPS O-acetylase OafA/YrhL [Leucobacter exalbidus]
MQSSSAISTARFGGLDGLRAVAVTLVLVYHFFPQALPGGFLGVDIFFVISGFLITSLLIRERTTHGRISLSGFWRRRARRLLPALGLVLLVCTSLAAAVGGDLLVGIGRQIAGAAAFVSNWVFIAAGADYFTRDTPELFRNTWSLAIEEQFYILLPLVVLLLLKICRKPTGALLLLVAGVASAVWMAELSLTDASPTRVYFGSDTHAFGLILGAALALATTRSGPALMPRLRAQLSYLAVALIGCGTLATLAVTLPEGSPQTFQGGFQLATAASLATVWAVTRPGAWIGRVLDNAPMSWVGARSYGIYLWHWPLLLIAGAAFPSWHAWQIALLTLLATLTFAALSFKYVEQPVRLLGLRRSLRLLVRPVRQTPRRRTVAVAVGAVLVVSIPATAYAVVAAPEQSSAEAAIARGAALVEAERVAAERAAVQEAIEAKAAADAAALQAEQDRIAAEKKKKAEAASKSKSSQKSTTTSKPAEAPKAAEALKSGEATKPSSSRGSEKNGSEKSRAEKKPASGKQPAQALPAPAHVTGADITAVGDSVMLASAPELNTLFPGISIDAAVSRGMATGVELVGDAAAQSTLRHVLVVGLGTNGTVTAEELEAIQVAAAGHPLVLVNAYGDREWIPGVNETIDAFAAAHRGVVVANWNDDVAGVPDALAGDEIHPNPSGGEIYAASIETALAALDSPQEAVGFTVPRR